MITYLLEHWIDDCTELIFNIDKHPGRVAASVEGIETSKLLWVMLIKFEHMDDDSLFWKASFIDLLGQERRIYFPSSLLSYVQHRMNIMS